MISSKQPKNYLLFIGERTRKISRRNYITQRRRIKVTFTDRFWDMVWPALAILDAVLAYTLIQIARGVL